MKKKLTTTTDTILMHFFQIYGVMALIALYVCNYIHSNVYTIFGVNHIGWSFNDLIGAATASFVILVGTSLLFEMLFRSYRSQQRFMFSLVKNLQLGQLGLLAITASTAEEIFFRAAIQPSLGILATSLLVSLAHIGKIIACPSLVFIVVLSNIIFGILYYYTNSLLPGIAVHFLVNCTTLMRYHRAFKQLEKHKN